MTTNATAITAYNVYIWSDDGKRRSLYKTFTSRGVAQHVAQRIAEKHLKTTEVQAKTTRAK